MAKKPIVGVCLCVVKKGKVLLHKRKGGHSDGAWAFPGGHLEYGESFIDGALRELNEEAGPDIVTTNPEFWTVANTIYESHKKQYVLIILKANWISGEAKVMEPSKCHCWQWFDWSNLPTPLLKGNQHCVDIGLEI